MLTRLSVTNFRSFRKAEFSFSPTGLTVVVGANASGKTNLIRCLGFLASLASEGLEGAIQSCRGFEGVFPKAVPKRDFSKTLSALEYSVDLPVFPTYPADAPPIRVTHRISFGPRARAGVRIESETIRFREPLLVQHCLHAARPARKTRGRQDRSHESASTPPRLAQLGERPPTSEIAFSRLATGRLTLAATPEISQATLSGYLQWLGLSFLKDILSKEAPPSPSEVIATVLSEHESNTRRTRAHPPARTSLIQPGSPLRTFSPEVKVLADFLSRIKRYDLQLAELRRQQDAATAGQLTPEGRGLPSAMRPLRSAKGPSWRRISGTLRELAPQICDSSVRLLRSGQEFVEFVEARTGRPVESWDASDGTLRALAILLAVESHSEEGIILIEEPEQALHPWAVRTVVAHIRKVIAERHLQVIITTHSQQVLDSVAPTEVLVATRTTAEGTLLRTVNELAEGNQLEMGDLGNAWVAGLLQGVPTAEPCD